MTEQEWLMSEDPALMLDHHQWMTNDRKLRLFVVALVNSNPTHNADTRSRFETWLERGLKTLESQDTGIEQARVQIKCYKDSGQACNLLREIVGNPFRPVTLPGGIATYSSVLGAGVTYPWLTPTVLSLAQAAYEDRLTDGTLDPHRLAVLSDALEEAGCNDERILTHLRSPGPHVRGCWVLDMILGNV